MNTSPRATQAYIVQAIITFAVALGVVVVGEVNLSVPPWTRAFLALGTVFLVSSTFTLAKCIRDQHESDSVLSRIDQARLERLLAEYDPFRGVGGPAAAPASSAASTAGGAPAGAASGVGDEPFPSFFSGN